MYESGPCTPGARESEKNPTPSEVATAICPRTEDASAPPTTLPVTVPSCVQVQTDCAHRLAYTPVPAQATLPVRLAARPEAASGASTLPVRSSSAVRRP